MYRQRFFQEVVPRLLKVYQESESCNKAACFAAIANQLAFIPEGVLIAHITTLIPLLIQCLSTEQPPQLIISTINAFMGLISDNVNAIEEYISSLVPRLLKLAKDGFTMVRSLFTSVLCGLYVIVVLCRTSVDLPFNVSPSSRKPRPSCYSHFGRR